MEPLKLNQIITVAQIGRSWCQTFLQCFFNITQVRNAWFGQGMSVSTIYMLFVQLNEELSVYYYNAKCTCKFVQYEGRVYWRSVCRMHSWRRRMKTVQLWKVKMFWISQGLKFSLIIHPQLLISLKRGICMQRRTPPLDFILLRPWG